jgi:type II secretory pathway component PulK
MKLKKKNNGSALLMVVFIVALLAAVVMGMLQVNTEEIQIMQNQIFAAQALAIAEAGLAEELFRIRQDWQWDSEFTKAFNDDSYTVTIEGSKPNLTIESTGTTAQGFVCKVRADLVVGNVFPYAIRINNFKIN